VSYKEKLGLGKLTMKFELLKNILVYTYCFSVIINYIKSYNFPSKMLQLWTINYMAKVGRWGNSCYSPGYDCKISAFGQDNFGICFFMCKMQCYGALEDHQVIFQQQRLCFESMFWYNMLYTITHKFILYSISKSLEVSY
jgi:hypothetical protein